METGLFSTVRVVLPIVASMDSPLTAAWSQLYFENLASLWALSSASTIMSASVLSKGASVSSERVCD